MKRLALRLLSSTALAMALSKRSSLRWESVCTQELYSHHSSSRRVSISWSNLSPPLLAMSLIASLSAAPHLEAVHSFASCSAFCTPAGVGSLSSVPLLRFTI